MEEHAKKRVGVLALQGAFQEHSAVLQQLGAQTHEVRTTADLDGLDGIVLPGAFGCWDRTHSIAGLNTRVCAPHPDPGGESTAMAIVEGGDGLFAALKQWVSDDKPARRFPCWLCSPVRSRATHTPSCSGLGHVRGHDPAGGRCGRSKGVKARLSACGAIGDERPLAFLIPQRGGQALVGGLHVQVCRNFFGSQVCGILRHGALGLPLPRLQVSSFEVPIPVPSAVQTPSGNEDEGADATASPHRAVFIRAPAIMTASEDVEVLAKVSAVPSPAAREAIEAIDLPDGAGRGQSRSRLRSGRRVGCE